MIHIDTGDYAKSWKEPLGIQSPIQKKVVLTARVVFMMTGVGLVMEGVLYARARKISASVDNSEQAQEMRDNMKNLFNALFALKDLYQNKGSEESLVGAKDQLLKLIKGWDEKLTENPDELSAERVIELFHNPLHAVAEIVFMQKELPLDVITKRDLKAFFDLDNKGVQRVIKKLEAYPKQHPVDPEKIKDFPKELLTEIERSRA